MEEVVDKGLLRRSCGVSEVEVLLGRRVVDLVLSALGVGRGVDSKNSYSISKD